MGFMGRTGMSPPKAVSGTGTASTQVPSVGERLPTQLAAKDTTVATWKLSRDTKCSDVSEPLVLPESDAYNGVSKAE